MTSAIWCPLVSGWSQDVHQPFPQRFQPSPAPPRGLHNCPWYAGGGRVIGSVQSCNAWCALRHAPWHGRCPSPRERRSPPQEQAHLADRHRHVPDSEQHRHRTRWHGLPVPRRDGSLVMDHQPLTRAFGSPRETGITPSSPSRVLRHPPDAFHGVQVVASRGW
jgi:hypothetical protein